jgi:hypothetical protein
MHIDERMRLGRVMRIARRRMDVSKSGCSLLVGCHQVLVETDAYTVLTDPVFSHRCSPLSWAGPARYRDPPCRLAIRGHGRSVTALMGLLVAQCE